MKFQMMKNLMILIAVLFAIPSAHAQLPVYKDAINLAHFQLEMITSEYESGHITEGIAHALVTSTKLNFESAVEKELEPKGFIAAETVKTKFNKFENYEIEISELTNAVDAILDADGIERPGNTHIHQEQRK